MEAQQPIKNKQTKVQKEKDKDKDQMTTRLQILPIDQYYLLRPSASIISQKQSQYVAKSFILFVIQCRSGINDQGLLILKRNILDMIQDYLTKGIDGMGFIINEQYYPLRNYKSIEAVKDLLINLQMREEVSFQKTLTKLRHIVTSQISKLQNKKLTLIFFSSPVTYDKLNPLKQSYIRYLNRHKFDYQQVINHVRKTIKKICVDSQAYVVGFSGPAQENQPIDDQFLYELTFCAHRYGQFRYASSYKQLQTSLKQIGASSVYQLSIINFNIPRIVSQKQLIEAQSKKKKVFPYFKFSLTNSDEKEFCLSQMSGFTHVHKLDIDLYQLKSQGYFIEYKKKNEKTEKMDQFKLKGHNVEFVQPTFIQKLNGQSSIYSKQMRTITFELISEVIKMKKIRDPNNKVYYVQQVNEQLQFKLRQKIQIFDKKIKEMYLEIFQKFKDKQLNIKQNEKGMIYQKYSFLKNLLDQVQFTLSQILKKQISSTIQIAKLAAAITRYSVKKSLKNKLVKRINANPRMLDEAYQKIHVLCTQMNPQYYSWQAKYKQQKSEVGNCCYSDCNFVTSLMEQDCLAIMFEVQRPDAAIADPGRLRMRQISPFVVRVSKFFKIHYYGVIEQFYNPYIGDNWIRDYSQVYKQGYKQMWDYWNRADNQKVSIGLMPLYITQQNWKVAKLLMKPCLAWTACAQPLAYTFSQTQTIPFMVLSFLIRKNQQLKYRIDQLEIQASQQKIQKNMNAKEHERNIVKLQKSRISDLLKHTHRTCQQILKDCSSKYFQEKMIDNIIKKYTDYQKPINRTVDIINNNSTFISQIYCAITTGMMEKPEQNSFHEFFKRLIEEQLRRQTDGWNQEQVQQKFINKLLNSQIQQMEQPKYQVMGSLYKDNFQAALQGQLIARTQFQIQRDKLEMILKKNNKFNDTQYMTLVQYKRLYENRVLWMWYVRFLLYQQKQRKQIHKWKCLDLTNSYQLFTMIIQNKKQRKNYKRRQAIQRGQYADPYQYKQARQFLQSQFMKIRAKKQSKNIQLLNAKKYDNASSTFAYSLDLKQAAGALMNIQIGKQIMTYFYTLMKGDAFLIHQKLRMILLGQYMGVQLIRGGNGWKMNRKKNRLLQNKYKGIYHKYRYMV